MRFCPVLKFCFIIGTCDKYELCDGRHMCYLSYIEAHFYLQNYIIIFLYFLPKTAYAKYRLFECLNVTCFALFLLQMGFLINSRLNPAETISHTEQKKLSEISFPAVFRVCIKPAFNLTALQVNLSATPIYFPGSLLYFLQPDSCSGSGILEQLALFCRFFHY